MWHFNRVVHLFVVLSLFSPFSSCEDLPSPGSRIINGWQVMETSEHVVEVNSFFQDLMQTWGGGTLITPKVVLTQTNLILGYDHFKVRFASYVWGNLYEVDVQEAVPHPLYNLNTLANDIGLLKLTVSVDESELMMRRNDKTGNSLRLFNSISVAPGVMTPMSLYKGEGIPIERFHGEIQGFGMTGTEPMAPAIVLKAMNQSGVTNEECRTLLGSRASVLTDTHYCAIDRRGLSSACNFDQGNGYIMYVGTVPYVMGILSIFTNMCRPQFATLYTRVNDYIPWIEDTLGKWN